MSDFLDDNTVEELYEENELVVEEQDLRLIKGIVSEHDVAREFANSTDTKLFMGDARAFAEWAVDYYKKHQSLPTRRVMLEEIANPENNETASAIWECLGQIEFNKEEFKHDMAKIKQRYTQQKIASMQETIQEGTNVDNILVELKKDLDDATQVKRGNKRAAFTQRTMKDYIQDFRAEYVAKQNDPEKGRGIMTNYAYLDYVTNGLSPSDMLLIAGETGAGKALPLDTLIPTPSGFKKMEDIHPGDIVFGRDGNSCKVIAESQVWNSHGWKFIFNDGTSVISHDNHEWLTFNRAEQIALSRDSQKFLTGGSIRTSADIAKTIKTTDGRNNHAIPLSECLNLPDRELSIDPYVLGLWLGDGHSLDGRITTACKDAFVKAGFSHSKTYDNGSAAKTYSFLGLRAKLRELNLIGNKHIPDDYLWASREQRIAIVQGLMDSDGFVSTRGQVEFVNTKEKLATGLSFLLNSLGEKCTITQGEAKLNGKVTGTKWTVRYSPHFKVFRLKRKLDRQNAKARLNRFRYITEAIRVKACEMKCIQVDADDHLFLATEHLIPTHNSMLLSNMAIQMWMQQNTICDSEDPKLSTTEYTKGYNIQYFSLEMPFDQCFRRAFARIGSLPTYGLRDARISDPDMLQRMSHAARFIQNYPYNFEIVDIPRGVTVKDIEERYLDAVARGVKPDIIAVDYLGLMQDPDSDGDDWLRLGHISGELHEFARTYNVVMISAVQLNRTQNRKPEEAIGMHRIGRSSLIMHHASIGIQIETRKDEDSMRDLKYHIIKNRNGERGHHLLHKDFKTATVCDLDEGYKPRYEESKTSDPALEDISSMLENFGWSP